LILLQQQIKTVMLGMTKIIIIIIATVKIFWEVLKLYQIIIHIIATHIAITQVHLLPWPNCSNNTNKLSMTPRQRINMFPIKITKLRI
jgi:hypothetical protein